MGKSLHWKHVKIHYKAKPDLNMICARIWEREKEN